VKYKVASCINKLKQMALHKVIIEYQYNKKRNLNLTTPCCAKSNKDGKFTSFIGLPEIYGFCHSCGKTSLPPTLFKDENGNEFVWNDLQSKYEPNTSTLQSCYSSVAEQQKQIAKDIKYIPESTIWEDFYTIPENNLLQYLRKTYCNDKVNDAKETYVIGTSKNGGTIFWEINSNLQVQKAKISYYDENGKRNNQFKVPYKNEEGYYACLYGEQLVYDDLKGKKTVILVESQKTAIVGYINLPEYIWVAYGGINGLTKSKLLPLIGHTVLIIPDMSENAVNIIYDKIPSLIAMGINAKVWDMTQGKTDEELKTAGLYNNDLEDYFRALT
jgi:hypothetical protein